ncbi:MAG TPA: ABC-F type ribosomal protection protein [Candidatus Pelethocola excrementipullorum]|nr:ABC-F type ribosomal protection protein [Candidatus Pelethocola excrementipullorum]
MSLISVQDLTFYYEGSDDLIFDQVSFQIDTDWRLGFIGRNGRGKTTFLNLLLGKYEYRGTISSGEVFDYFPYPVKDRHRDTIDIIEETDPSYELWKVCRELNLMEMDCDALYRPFSTLSNGEQTKVLLSVLFAKDHHFLLIDEPTNHLDMESRKKLMEYLNQKKGFILVSHDRDFLDGCIDHVLSINKSSITITKGNFSTWWEEKENQDHFELAQNEKLKKDIKKLEKAAATAENWSDKLEKTKKGTRIAGLRPDRGHIGHKAAKMMKRSKNLEYRAEAALEEKTSLLKNLETVDDLKIMPLRHHKEVLVRMEDVEISYDQRKVLEKFNLELKNGDRIALQGSNGCGKSSILKMILGINKNYSGLMELASGLVISYVPQDTSELSGTLNEFAETWGVDETLFKTILRKLDFARSQFDKRMEEFSEGQKKKVLIARSLSQQAHLYVWDEPLNYIDVFSRMQIEQLILKFKPSMLLVEHDGRFIRDVATKVIYM